MIPLDTSNLLIATEEYVNELFRSDMPATRYFHSYDHTRNVVRQCRMLAGHYKFSAEEELLLTIAAWFHDAGYAAGSDDHEESSVHMAMEFLDDYALNAHSRFQIEQLILATKIPAHPGSLAEQIICDADLQHLASDDYPVWSARLKKEAEAFDGTLIPEKDWLQKNIIFFDRHEYYTEGAWLLWNAQKKKNYEALVATLADIK